MGGNPSGRSANPSPNAEAIANGNPLFDPVNALQN